MKTYKALERENTQLRLKLISLPNLADIHLVLKMPWNNKEKASVIRHYIKKAIGEGYLEGLGKSFRGNVPPLKNTVKNRVLLFICNKYGDWW